MRFGLILLFLFVLFQASVAVSIEIDVEVAGLEKDMEQNALFFLGIAQRNNDIVTIAELNRLFRKGAAQIKKSLIPFGYYEPNVEGNLEKMDKGWKATYTVEKGQPVTVDEILIEIVNEGKENPDLQEVVQNARSKEGAVLNQPIYEQFKKGMLRVAYSNGYIKSKFTTHVIRVDRTRKTAAVHLVLDTGPLYYFGDISSSQKVIIPRTLQKYIDIKPGDPYVEKQMAALQRALYNSGYFKFVRVKGLPLEEKDFQIPVVIEAEPIEFKNKYDLGVGYATNTGFHAKIGWKNRLFNSRGHAIRSTLKVAEQESEFSVFYEIPVLNPSYDTHVLGTAFNREKWEDTDTKLLTVGASLSHDGPRFKYGASLESRDERYSVGSTDGDAFLIMPSATWGILLADNLLNTRMGLKLSVNIRGSSELLLSDVDFLQGDAGAKAIFSPFEKWRLIGRINVGATWVDSIEELPPSLRFYTGGDQSVRGFGYKQIAPEDDSGTLVGGKYLLVESLEVEREFSPLWSLAAFYDAGNAMDSFPDTEKKEGVGGGIRVRLPFGQIRFDVACAISEEDNPFRVHLNVGGDL